jgi:hypothetical protein
MMKGECFKKFDKILIEFYAMYGMYQVNKR